MFSSTLLERVDHLVYVTEDLDRGVAEIELLLGIRASPGGRHSAWGTRNALVALGSMSYLEIIAPDPDHPPSHGERPFGLDSGGTSRLVGWAVNGCELELLRASAAVRGVVLGNVQSGERRQADGAVLSWALTDLRYVVADGIVPFFIDWGRSAHPAQHATRGATLLSLQAEHPDVDRVSRMLLALDLDLPLKSGPVPALIAKIDCPNGRVTVR